MNRRPGLRLNAAQNLLIDGEQSETFIISMGTSVSQLTARNLTPGQLYIFVMRQDWQGGHRINWGAAAINGNLPHADPHAITVQSFVAINRNQLFAASFGTWN